MNTAANMSERSRPIEHERVTAEHADRAAALAEGLSELELPFRATLELRYRRGLPDSTIAAVAQFEEEEIVRQRSRALVWLAQRAGIEGPDAIDVVESGLTLLWTDEPATPPEVAPTEGPEPEPDRSEPEPAADPEPEPAVEPEPEPVAEPEPAAQAEPEPRTEPMPLVESVPPPSSGPPTSRAAAAPLPSPKPFPRPQSKKQAKSKPSEGSNRRLLGLLAIGAAIIVLVVILTSGGSDESTDGTGAPPVASTTTKGSDKPTSASVTMQMLPGVDGSGQIDVTMSGDPARPEIDMKLVGLPNPDGEYRAWLYKSVIDSRSLGKAGKGDGEIIATLPKNWQDYPFVDVSIQKPGSIAHSGRSVSRISTKDLPLP